MPMAGNPALAANSGLRSIPSRTIRTPATQQMPQIDPAVQAVLIKANEIQYQQQPPPQAKPGRVPDPGLPPLPPVDDILGVGPPVPQ
jgi:hypothetical protein